MKKDNSTLLSNNRMEAFWTPWNIFGSLLSEVI